MKLPLISCTAVLCLCTLLASCASAGGSIPKPLWASQDTIDSAYPRAAYIARIGTAQSAGAAATLAEGELTTYFSHAVTVSATASQTLDSAGLSKSALTREVSVRAAMELFAVHKTEPWYDKAAHRYAVCAYIDREEAWALYKPHVIARRDAFLSFYRKAAKESDAFKKIKLLHATEESAAAFAEDLDFVRLLAPAHEGEFAAERTHVASLPEQLSSARLSATMRISVKKDDGNRVLRTVTGLLSGAGYYLSDTGYAYQVNATVEPNYSKHSVDGDTIITAEPGLTVIVTNGSEKLFSYNKTFSRISGFSEAFVNKKLYAAVEDELNATFLAEFKAALE